MVTFSAAQDAGGVRPADAALADQLLAARRSMVVAPFDAPNSAATRLRRELRAARRTHGKRSLQVADASVRAAFATQDSWERRRNFNRALSIAEAQAGATHALYGRYLTEAAAGMIYLRAKRKSDDYLERAEAFFERQPDALEVAQLQWLRGVHWSNQGNNAAATEQLGRAGSTAARSVGRYGDDALQIAMWAYLRPLPWLVTQPDRDGQRREFSRALARLKAPDGDAEPELLVQFPPEIAPVTRRSSLTGTVHYTLSIDDTGRVTDVEVDRVEGPDALGQLFAPAALRWQFSPRVRNGEIVACRVRNKYRFY